MIEETLIEKILRFRDERNWRQFHNPKDLAISISLEAAKLLEKFQWSGTDLEVRDKTEETGDELADVLIYCVLMADAMGMDIGVVNNGSVVITRKWSGAPGGGEFHQAAGSVL